METKQNIKQVEFYSVYRLHLRKVTLRIIEVTEFDGSHFPINSFYSVEWTNQLRPYSFSHRYFRKLSSAIDFYDNKYKELS